MGFSGRSIAATASPPLKPFDAVRRFQFVHSIQIIPLGSCCCCTHKAQADEDCNPFRLVDGQGGAASKVRHDTMHDTRTYLLAVRSELPKRYITKTIINLYIGR